MRIFHDDITENRRSTQAMFVSFAWCLCSVAFGFWMESFWAGLWMTGIVVVLAEVLDPLSGRAIKIIPAVDADGNEIKVTHRQEYRGVPGDDTDQFGGAH